MLNKVLFKLFNELIRASAASAEVQDDVGHLVKCEVLEETLIH